MKTFKDNASTIKAFVSRKYTEGKNKQGNISFRDNRLFSYNTVICEFKESDLADTLLVYFDNRSYSKTTTRLQSRLRWLITSIRDTENINLIIHYFNGTTSWNQFDLSYMYGIQSKMINGNNYYIQIREFNR
jgi:hypothetical protein